MGKYGWNVAGSGLSASECIYCTMQGKKARRGMVMGIEISDEFDLGIRRYIYPFF